MEVKDSPEYKALEKKLNDLSTKFEDKTAYITTLKKSVDDITSDRSELKKKLADAENKKTTDGATAEQLKELLKQKEGELEGERKSRSHDRIRSKLTQKALEKGFVKNSGGTINARLLEAQFDISKLTEDDDGNIYGLDEQFDKLKESEPYMFEKKKAVPKDIDDNVRKIEGTKTDSKAFQDAKTPAEKIAIIKARGVQFKKDNDGFMPGMGNAAALAAPVSEAKED